MIQALQYEPQGQRQRFEPQEQQRAERGDQDRHIHLHLHLNLTLRASQKRSTHPNVMRIARICAALLESRKSTQARPKDASPSDVDSPGES